MAIQFIVEDGTGKSTATAYISVAEFKQYWENRGTTFAESDSTIQGWINLSTEYIDANYKFQSYKTYETQALAWPRANVIITRENKIIDSSEIPNDLKNATAYLALQVKNFSTLFGIDEGVQAISYGPVSKTFSRTDNGKVFPLADKYLKDFLISGNIMVRVN